MSQFYARYIPPSKAVPPENSASPSKRKREEPIEHTTGKSKAKKQKVQISREKDHNKPENGRPSQKEEENGTEILKKYSITGYAKDKGQNDIKRHKVLTKIKTRKSPPLDAETEQTNDTQDDSAHDMRLSSGKHSSVLSKFAKSKKRSRNLAVVDDPPKNDSAAVEEIETHDLGPIPQPEIAEPVLNEPTFATLPSWQINIIKATKQEDSSFDSMNISKAMLANLKKKNIVHAFPIQSTVIPLLLGSQRHVGDLCISAATGSGKTLAYIVPIVENIRSHVRTALRAVIVVPTRELVKQVQQTCELCASGSKLKIVTAVGTNSLQAEQEDLVEAEDVYDPVEYRKQREMPIDWSKIDLMAELEKKQRRHTKPIPNYVTRLRSKADILITTPGRIVDHLKNTKGFNLDDTEWLVVDEADRLLSESYQEWVDVVGPALRSRNATSERDDALRSMLMDLPPRKVHKILLSATMTRDISKLNALELKNPKLVVLSSALSMNESNHLASGNSAMVSTSDPNNEYSIPVGLSETVLAFKDGAEKPLILLQWIYKHLQPSEEERQLFGGADSTITKTLHKASQDETSSDPGSDTSSESDNDSSSDSEDSSSISSSSSGSTDQLSSTEFEARIKDFKQGIQHEPRALRTQRALIFAKSTASALRLSRLLGLLSPQLESKIATLTRSTASSASSRTALASFQDGRVSILIATDRASRGVDVPGLENVVNYDIPGSAQTYIHRVGRTARAESSGHAWTLVEHREGRWFWNEIGGKSGACKIQRSKRVTKLEVKVEDSDLAEQYTAALQKLGEEVRSQ